MGRINRYRDTASMRKPTGQQLSEGASSLVGVLEEEMAGMHREQVARLPTFRNFATARGPGINSDVSANAERARTTIIRQFIRHMQNNDSSRD